MIAPLNAKEALSSKVAHIDNLSGYQREIALIRFARFHSGAHLLAFCKDDIGRIAREAVDALARNLRKETPGRRWNNADPEIGRKSINRLLGVENHPESWFATIPFRSIEYQDTHWIAAAIGCHRILAWKAHASGNGWCHLDIRAVLLWDPVTNSVRLMGEHASSSQVVMPAPVDTLAVFGSPATFFRAWAQSRIRALMLHRQSGDVNGIVDREDTHNEMPGALIVGDIEHAIWPTCAAQRVVSVAGADPVALRQCIIRSAHLPSVVAGEMANG